MLIPGFSFEEELVAGAGFVFAFTFAFVFEFMVAEVLGTLLICFGAFAITLAFSLAFVDELAAGGGFVFAFVFTLVEDLLVLILSEPDLFWVFFGIAGRFAITKFSEEFPCTGLSLLAEVPVGVLVLLVGTDFFLLADVPVVGCLFTTLLLAV